MSEREMRGVPARAVGGEGEHQGARQGGAARGATRCWTRSSACWSSARSSPRSPAAASRPRSWTGCSAKKFRASKRGVGDAEIAAAVAEAAAESPGGPRSSTGGDNGDARAIQVAGPRPAHVQRRRCSSRPTTRQLLELHAEIAGLHKGPCTIVDAAEQGDPDQEPRRARGCDHGAGQGRGHAPALQGPRRDESRAALGDHHEPGDAHAPQA